MYVFICAQAKSIHKDNHVSVWVSKRAIQTPQTSKLYMSCLCVYLLCTVVYAHKCVSTRAFHTRLFVYLHTWALPECVLTVLYCMD
jgi:hypothetical protein